MMTCELFSPWLQAFAWHGTTASEQGRAKDKDGRTCTCLQLHGKQELVASANRLAPRMDGPVTREEAP